MDASELTMTIISMVALAGVGTACLVKPELIASYERKRYLRSNKFLQDWPFANMVLEPWYPTYLRFMGGFCWLFVLLVVYAVVFAQAPSPE